MDQRSGKVWAGSGPKRMGEGQKAGRCGGKDHLNLGAEFRWNRLGSSSTSQGQWDVNLALMSWGGAEGGGGDQGLGWGPLYV